LTWRFLFVFMDSAGTGISVDFVAKKCYSTFVKIGC